MLIVQPYLNCILVGENVFKSFSNGTTRTCGALFSKMFWSPSWHLNPVNWNDDWELDNFSQWALYSIKLISPNSPIALLNTIIEDTIQSILEAASMMVNLKRLKRGREEVAKRPYALPFVTNVKELYRRGRTPKTWTALLLGILNLGLYVHSTYTTLRINHKFPFFFLF